MAPLLARHRLCILPEMLSREMMEKTTNRGGTLFYVTVKVRFDFISSEDGSRHSVITYGEAMDSGDKATNKAMSAAYKYAAFQAFCIPTEGDNDSEYTTHQVQNNRRPINQRQQPVQQPVQQQQQQQQPTQRQQYYQTVAQDVREQRQQRTDTSKVEKVIGPGQFKLLKEAISMSGMTLEQFNRVCHLSQLGELPACKFKGAMNWLKEKAQAA